MNRMGKALLLFAVGIFSAVLVQAANPPQKGTVISGDSQNCGTKGESHKRSIDLLCQEYVIHGATTDYHIRQEKPSNQALFPVNSDVEFTIDKNKMKLKVAGKSYEYLITSEAAAGIGGASSGASARP